MQKLLGYTVDGWATIMVALLFLGGVQLVCLGILGEYVGRVFTEIKPRPMYILEEILQPPPQAGGDSPLTNEHETISALTDRVRG